ncbi:30S ribosomal protein S14 [Candidatus Spongiihabitans sp.]|uniref:30S ribosomal protein S14 n=1 Tax=Candidatus Spongiihabitans sp. TaxID=3101308 RepID=UPI003C7E3122
MAKKSMIAREAKRRKLIGAHAEKRKELTDTISNSATSSADQFQAMLELQKLPRDSSPVRKRNRCALTGRPRGNYRKFGLCRNKLREVIMRGEAPGVVKSSW